MIYMLSTPVSLGRPSSAFVWQESPDIAPYLATGDVPVLAILSVNSTDSNSAARTWGFSNYGSSDTDTVQIQRHGAYLVVIGVGENASNEYVFEWYINDTSTVVTVYLHGYITGPYAYAHTNKQSQSLADTNYNTFTANRNGTDSQSAVFLYVGNPTSSYATIARVNGSSYDNYNTSNTLFRATGMIVGVDGSRQYQVKASNSNQTVTETGYVMPGINLTLHDPPTDISRASTGSYLSYSLGSGALGAFIENKPTGTTKYAVGWRAKSESVYDPYGTWMLGNGQTPCIADANGDIEGKIENTALDSYLYATITAPTVNTDRSPAAATLALSVVAPTGIQLQTAFPDSDAYLGEWTDEGDGTTDIYLSIDENTPSDSDYIQSDASPSASVYVTKLTGLGDPTSSSNHVVNYRYKKDSATQTMGLTIQLRQGYVDEGTLGTLIATVLSDADVSTDWTQGSYTLSSGEADSITNYSDLYLRFSASAS